METRFRLLRSASNFIVGVGIVVTIVVMIIGLIALFNRPFGDSGIILALYTFAGVLGGLFIAGTGQIAQVLIDVSDCVHRIEASLETTPKP